MSTRPQRALWTSIMTVAASLLVALSVTGPAAPAAAQSDPPRQRPAPIVDLRVASVSPWVESDGDFQVRFEPTLDVPAGAELSVTLHQAITSRSSTSVHDTVGDMIGGASLGRILRTLPARPITDFGDPTVGAVVNIPVRPSRGEPDRVLVPNAGVHPVELVLTSAEGPELWRQTVFLNRLPTTTSTQPSPVAIILPVETGPSLDADGAATFDHEDVQRLRTLERMLAEVTGPAVVTSIDPNTLDGLDLVEEPWAEALLDRLRTLAADRPLLQRSYVPVDSGALVASNGSSQLFDQVVFGRSKLRDHLGAEPLDTVWALDESVTPGVLPVLSSLGVTTLYTMTESLELPRGVEPDQLLGQAVRLSGTASMQAVTYDVAATSALGNSTAEPAVRANDALTLLMATWFDAAKDSSPTAPLSVIVLPPDTDAALLNAVGAAAASDGPLRPASADDLAPSEPTSRELEVGIDQRSPADLSGLVARAEQLETQIQSYSEMTAEADPTAALWTQLLFQSFDRSLDSVDRAVVDETITAELTYRLGLVHPPRDRRVVLTRSDPVIPLRFRNDLPFDVRVRMEVRSSRLDVSDISDLVLVPGENRIDLPVTVRAAGESLLRIEVTSPDGNLALSGSDVPVRSTAISGVGAALSVVSLAFLLGWWALTYVRSRREPAEDDPTVNPTQPDDPVA